MTIPLACFAVAGADLGAIEAPFRITADKPFAAAFTAVQIVAGAAKDSMRCLAMLQSRARRAPARTGHAMKRLLLTLFLVLATSGLQAHDKALNVMSYNIRCGYCEQPDDVNHWSKRKTAGRQS